MRVGSRKLTFTSSYRSVERDGLNPRSVERGRERSVSVSRLRSRFPCSINQGPRPGLTWGSYLYVLAIIEIIDSEGKVVVWRHASDIIYKTMESLRGADAELRHLCELKHGKV